MSDSKISVWGARVHNLKNIDVTIPRNSLTVITGLSGSGKSSLAFDTIFAEGQRRYIETFSAYARNFLGNLQRPDVDKITGLHKKEPQPVPAACRNGGSYWLGHHRVDVRPRMEEAVAIDACLACHNPHFMHHRGHFHHPSRYPLLHMVPLSA